MQRKTDRGEKTDMCFRGRESETSTAGLRLHGVLAAGGKALFEQTFPPDADFPPWPCQAVRFDPSPLQCPIGRVPAAVPGGEGPAAASSARPLRTGVKRP